MDKFLILEIVDERFITDNFELISTHLLTPLDALFVSFVISELCLFMSENTLETEFFASIDILYDKLFIALQKQNQTYNPCQISS